MISQTISAPKLTDTLKLTSLQDTPAQEKPKKIVEQIREIINENREEKIEYID